MSRKPTKVIRDAVEAATLRTSTSAVRPALAINEHRGGRGRRGPLLRILDEMLADIIERERAGYPVDRGALGVVIAERFGIVASTGEPYSGAAVSNALSRVRKRTAATTTSPHAETGPGAKAPAAATTIAGNRVSTSAREAQTALAGTVGVVASQSGTTEERTVKKTQSNSPAERPRAHPGSGGPNLPPGFDDLTNPSVVDPKKPNPPKI